MTDHAPRACVIGWPVRHSRSPLVHRFWLDTLGIAGSYELAEIAPDAFDGFVTSMAEQGFVGGNVTIPYKERAFRLCRETSPVARALGATNTLWLVESKLHGDNTDVAGFLANLDAQAPGWSEPLDTAVMLGAGGAARAVLYALLARGARRIVVVNRSAERAQTLRALYPRTADRIEIAGWDDLAATLEGADLLVNTTSLGMRGQPPLVVDLSPLPTHACVNDLVYVPLLTPLLAAAHRRGLRAVDGLGMLLHQAAPGFARWFNISPQVTGTLRDRIAADIGCDRAELQI